MPDDSRPLLTETELELMLVLWKLEEATVRDVLAALPAERKMAYTTASTIIRILEKKTYVGNRKDGRSHRYFPLLAKADYESQTLGHVVDRLFDRTPASLVARLVSDERLSDDEINEIRRLLDSQERSS